MKNSVNPMDQHTADTSSPAPEKTTETIAHTETEQIASAEKKVDPLSDEHVGPVSR